MLQLQQDLEHYETFKSQDQPLEMLHLKLRTLIRDLTAALRSQPDNQTLRDRLTELQKELADLEQRAPWILRDHPVELALWGPLCGVL